MPRVLTAVTAGDHIDWMTTSPEAIRFTDWSNEVQNERNCPLFLMSLINAIVLSISSRVIFPLLRYRRSPRASTAMATSMTPIVGLSWSADLPLKSGLIRSAQLVIGRPVRSGRTPSVSAFVTDGIPVTQSLGPPANFWPSGPVAYRMAYGATPCVDALRPSGYSLLVKSGIVLSQYF